MDSTQRDTVDQSAPDNTEKQPEAANIQSGPRLGRGTALKALGAALLGGLLGGGAESRAAGSKRRTKKRRQKRCQQRCPRQAKPKPTPKPAPPSGPKVMWAIVDRGGQLARGSGAISAKRTSEGSYRVYFEQKVDECAYVAQIPYFSAHGEVYTHPLASEPESIAVFTYDTGNSAGRLVANKDFHVVVTC